MTYEQLIAEDPVPAPDFGNQVRGFTRVESDDRLLDAFSHETLEKGVELWEKWDENTVELIRIHNKNTRLFTVPRAVIERALLSGSTLTLS